MQLEVVYMQATMMAKSRWLDQLKVHMNPTRTSLTLVYWGGGSATAQWGSPQVKSFPHFTSANNTPYAIYLLRTSIKALNNTPEAHPSKYPSEMKILA
jgi:hypothetical protein